MRRTFRRSRRSGNSTSSNCADQVQSPVCLTQRRSDRWRGRWPQLKGAGVRGQGAGKDSRTGRRSTSDPTVVFQVRCSGRVQHAPPFPAPFMGHPDSVGSPVNGAERGTVCGTIARRKRRACNRLQALVADVRDNLESTTWLERFGADASEFDKVVKPRKLPLHRWKPKRIITVASGSKSPISDSYSSDRLKTRAPSASQLRAPGFRDS